MVKPSDWGPPLWYRLHMLTFGYPEVATPKDKALAIKYFTEVEKLLPCMKCRVHYRENLEANPIQYNVDTRDELVRWLIDLHNKVNAQTGKRILSYDEVISLYGTEPKKSNLSIVAMVLVLVLVILIVLKRTHKK